ncbi:PAS domain-containing protein (plasmid) [Bradyrhizobium lupini]|uniref:PAS domain-containing sensor histidine kinase n=1 Tax=Rhizobium lupini TaxID=136996 RepID=UPI00366C1D24
MVATSKDCAEEDGDLQRITGDLKKLLARAPNGGNGIFSQELSNLLEMLVDMLDLEFSYVRIDDSIGTQGFEVGRTAPSWGAIRSHDLGSLLRESLGQDWRTWPSNQRTAISGREVSILCLQLGAEAGGTLVAGSSRIEVTEEAQQLRLRIAGVQLAKCVMEARLSNERRRISGTIDQAVERRTQGAITLGEDRRHEIVELRRVAESLRVREIDIQLVVDAIPAPLAIMTAEGEVEVLNRPVLEYFGKSVEELKHWKTIDAVHPEDLQSTISTWRRGVESGQPYEMESRHRRSDGVYRWFHVRGFPLRDTDGRIVRWCVLQIDVEDRKRAENALRSSERNLDLIINSIPAFVWSARPDGSAEFFNQHYLNYVGLSLEAAQDWGWTTTVHPDDLSDLAGAWQQIMNSREAGEKEARLRRFDGTYRWFLFRANPLRDEAGNVIRWFGLNADIEDRKRAEEELRNTQAKLAHMARVMTMGELTASIAHEISQPLSGIVTNASTCLRMLAADPPNVPGARETARRTIRDANRASAIIGRLRALFNRKAPVSRPVDLNEATREVVALSLDRFRRDGVNLGTELSEDLPLVLGDRVQLQQVILNLIQNALDAMNATGPGPREMIIRTERGESNQVRLSIQDSGPGFDAVEADRLFDAFYTTKSEGMGIGLSVSRSIIENHHGRLWAVPNDGPGVTFSFSIPQNSEDETSDLDFEAREALAGNCVTRDP